MGKIKEFAHETLIYGFANVFSRVFAMFLIPLYTSYLGKIDYSNLIMLQSLFAVLTFLLALNSGVFYYYYEYEKEKYRKIVFTSWFYYQLVVSLILLGVLILSAGNLKDLFIINQENEKTIVIALFLIGFQFFPFIMNNTNMNLFRINRQPKKVMMITFLESLFTLTFVAGGLIYFSFGIVEILGAQIVARLLVTLIYLNQAFFFLRIKHFSKLLMKRMLQFSWPFFVISSFSWVIISIDKFVGAEALSNKEDVAILALAMQLTIPIAVLADMIRMAIGPFVMSIRKEVDAEKSYQRIFDLSVFSSSLLLVGLIVISPLAIYILADASFLKAIQVIPLIAFASVLSLIYNQLTIAFSLSKKNVYILIATVIGGILGFSINILYMHQYGFIVSGISQIAAYALMVVLLYYLGKKLTKTELKLKSSLISLLVLTGFIFMLFLKMPDLLNGHFISLVIYGGITVILLTVIYFRQQHISIMSIWNRVLG